MSAPGPQGFPDSALEWLAPTQLQDAHILAFGRSTAPVVRRLAHWQARLVVADVDTQGVRSLSSAAPRAVTTVARPEALPFVPCAFDAVFVHQNLHTFGVEATLNEFARVLVPAGRLAVSWTVRDDSVPWVRRLIALMRDVDPAAMQGNYGTEVVTALDTSPYFTDVESRSARLWVPIARVDLLAMVAKRFPNLDPERRTRLMSDVGALYESSARPPAPLLLPYRVACWRATVDHTEFTSALDLPDSGLPIRL